MPDGARPIATLTTDFGSGGSYPGAVRGVLLSRCPRVRLVDVTHPVAPFSALEASLVLAEACPWFPPGTVHRPVDAVVRTYADAPAGTVVALFGSAGFLEVAVVEGSEARALGAGVGDEVRVET